MESLCRDRERRASVAIDQLSFVASPNGFLTAARAAAALEAVAADAAAALAPPNGDRDGMGVAATTEGKKSVDVDAAVLPAAPLLLRPSVSTSVHVKVGEFRSLLSLESRPLASLSVTGLAFEASRSEWWDLDEINPAIFRNLGHPHTSVNVDLERKMPSVGWPGWAWTGGRHRTALGYLRVSLQGLELLDLTTDGQLHNQVISHAGAPGEMAASPGAMRGGAARETSSTDRRASGSRSSRGHGATTKEAAAAAQRLPVIVVELIPENFRRSGGGEINASVRGLRVCFLHRFVAEITKYFGPDRLGPVVAVVRSFGRRGGGVAGSEAEDESVAVVVGEEDLAVPDEWSIASSEDGRDGDPGTARGGAGASSAGASGSGEAGAGMRVIAVLQDLTVVVPRNTHSREAAAVECKELVLEVSREESAQS